MIETKEQIKEKLRQKYTTLERSGIQRQTFYEWENNGLPKSVKKFFEIARKTDTDPWVLYNVFSSETENPTQL
jgi:hypothetical protein